MKKKRVLSTESAQGLPLKAEDLNKIEQFGAILVLIEIIYFPQRCAWERGLKNLNHGGKWSELISGRHFGYDNVGLKMQMICTH